MSDTSYDKLKSKGIQQSLIDSLVFFLANAGGHEISKEIPPSQVNKVIIFALSDLGVRNSYITWWNEYFKTSDASMGLNAYIAMYSFLFGTLYDLVGKKELGKALKENLIRNALGLVGNEVVDRLIPMDYN